MSKQLDNSTLRHKVSLRQRMLATLTEPAVVCETHGGWGDVFESCYAQVDRGVVFETDPAKSESLARRRPGWSVYETDCLLAIRAGAASHLRVNVLDVDPYGAALPIIEAFLTSERSMPDELHVVVNDGLKQSLRVKQGWRIPWLADIVADWGNDLYRVYMDVAKEKVRRYAAAAGYRLERWHGYHCGKDHDMTHYWALLRRVSDAVAPAADSDNPAAGTSAGRA